MSDSSGLLSITSAARINIPCEAVPRRTEVVSEGGIGTQGVSLYQKPVSGQHKVLLGLVFRKLYWKSWGWG